MRLLLLSTTLLGLTSTAWPAPSSPSDPALSPHSLTLVVTAASPQLADRVEISAAQGHPVLLASTAITLGPGAVSASLPVQLEIPEGTDLKLVGHDGIQLRVRGDTTAPRHWELTGSTIHLTYDAHTGGPPRLRVLEAGELQTTTQ